MKAALMSLLRLRSWTSSLYPGFETWFSIKSWVFVLAAISHFPYLCQVKVKSLSRVRLFATPWTIRLLRPWDFPGQITGVDCRFLLQGIFPTQESNPGLPHCRQTLYCLSHQGSLCCLLNGDLKKVTPNTWVKLPAILAVSLRISCFIGDCS